MGLAHAELCGMRKHWQSGLSHLSALLPHSKPVSMSLYGCALQKVVFLQVNRNSLRQLALLQIYTPL